MILTVDTGGTKTRIATFDDDGNINHEVQYETPHDTGEYIRVLVERINTEFNTAEASAIVVAVPGLVENGIVRWLGNLHWRDFDIASRLRSEFNNTLIWVENDANLGAIGAMAHLEQDVKHGVYLTLSTGIRAAFTIDGQISPDLEHAEIGHMVLEHDGQLVEWESFASGRAFFERTGGKFGAEVFDPDIWRDYARDVALGFLIMIPFFQPETVVIGGSMGTHFAKYGDFLRQFVDQALPSVFARPEIVPATNPEHIVNYGALIYAKQQLASQETV